LIKSLSQLKDYSSRKFLQNLHRETGRADAFNRLLAEIVKYVTAERVPGGVGGRALHGSTLLRERAAG